MGAVIDFPARAPDPEQPRRPTADEVLQANIGRLSAMTLVGLTPDGHLIVAGTQDIAGSFLMLAQAHAAILEDTRED
jgi:hypothetical protein